MQSVKVVVMGAENTGKTSLVKRITERTYNEQAPPTIATCFSQITLNTIKFEIWDTAGKEHYRPMLPLYYQSAKIALLTFCDQKSFGRIKGLTTELQASCSPNLPIIIVRTKSDTTKDQQVSDQVSDAEVTAFQEEKNIPICLLNTSAKQNTNCDNLFKTILALTEVATFLKLNVAPPPSPRTEVSDTSISLSPYKDVIIKNLAQYISTKRNKSSFDLSKEEKISAAMKIIACFFGANISTLNFSRRERAALLEGDLKNHLNRVLEAGNIQNMDTIPLLPSLKKTSDAVRRTPNNEIYINALIEFLTIYRNTRNQNPKMHYFFSTGCSKTDKISATDKLIAQLSERHTSSSFTPEEITALNDGALKKTIQTTLTWFSSDGAPTFEAFMKEQCIEKKGFALTV